MVHLPRTAYTAQEWFEREQTGLFGQTWVFAGTMSDFKIPSDYVTVQAGAYTLVALLLKDGKFAAYHNICRHRGTTLLDGTGNTGKSIVCPYHR